MVGRSVSQLVTSASPAKTAEPIEMPFGVVTAVSQRNYVLERVQIPGEGAIFGKK